MAVHEHVMGAALWQSEETKEVEALAVQSGVAVCAVIRHQHEQCVRAQRAVLSRGPHAADHPIQLLQDFILGGLVVYQVSDMIVLGELVINKENAGIHE